MGRMFWIRVGGMAITLAAVLWAMYFLNRKPEAVFAPGAKVVYRVEDSKTVVLCPTRVTSLILPNGTKISEDHMKWMKTAPGMAPVELNAIAVEKWFAANCSLKARAGAGVAKDFHPLVQMRFVNGEFAALEASSAGEYRFNGREFTSPQLTEALRTLAALPPARAPGQK